MSCGPTLERRPLNIGVYGARGIPSTYSGFETFLTVLLPELVRRGHTVTAYCRRGQVPPGESYQGVRCVHLRAVRSKKLSTPLHGWVAAMRAMFARHDVVLVMNVAHAPVCTLTRLLRQRIVLNPDGLEWERAKWGRVARGVFLASAHLAPWAASALVADSVGMYHVYRTRFGARSTVIPYCWTGIEPRPSSALQKWGLEHHGYALVAARFVPENNVDAIAASYLATDLKLPLVVLGTANYASPVQHRLKELACNDARLVLPGHVDDRTLFACLIANARVYLHGHSVGGINPVLIEAMGCGARILALDTVFNREALGDAGDYFAHPDELAAPLLQVVGEPWGRSEEMRRKAQTRATSRFALGAVASAYESLLLRVVAQSPWSRCDLKTPWQVE